MEYIALQELALDFVSFFGGGAGGGRQKTCTYRVSFGALGDYSRSLEKKEKVIKLRKKIKINPKPDGQSLCIFTVHP